MTIKEVIARENVIITFWLGRYESGYWDKETFEKRLGKTKDHPFRRISDGEEMWETLKNSL